MAFGDQTKEFLERKKAEQYLLVLDWAGQLEAYAKLHRPWTDRTGMARKTLHGGVDVRGKQFVLYLSHGVTYGIFLELAHGGKWAIVGPTIDVHLPRIKQSILDHWRE